jgi:hypothetical protein
MTVYNLVNFNANFNVSQCETLKIYGKVAPRCDKIEFDQSNK